MIEIEKKFALRPGDEESLLEGAEFVKEVVNEDTYWDYADYRLTIKRWWLRSRNGQWELKIALPQSGGFGVDRYDELETEKEVREKIVPESASGVSLEEDLRVAGIEPFGTIRTTRRKYRHGSFNIDLDIADYGHTLCEIEIMVTPDADMDAAAQSILDFARKHGVSTDKVRGKVLEYLFRFRPEHYEALQRAWAK